MGATRGLAVRDDYRYWSQVPTRWNDNDIYGHVNNTVHYAAMDTVINRWMIEQGILDLAGTDAIGLCVESGCRYLASMEYPDVMAVGLRIAKLGNSSVTWEAGIVRDRDDLVVAEGRFVHVFVDRLTRRPAPLAEPMRAAITALIPPA
jgi:acyl-CoA thioester hydrolase